MFSGLFNSKNGWDLRNSHKTWRIRNHPININNERILFCTDSNFGEDGVVEYHVIRNTFSIIKYPPEIDPQYHSYCQYQNNIYIVTTDGTIIVYDIKKQTFEHITEIKNKQNIGRYSSCFNIGDDLIHIIGGTKNKHHLIYAIKHNKYVIKANFGAVIENACIVKYMADNKIFMFTGHCTDKVFVGTITNQLHHKKITWELSDTMKIPNMVRNCGYCLYGNFIILLGGIIGTNINNQYSDTIYLIDLQNNGRIHQLNNVYCPSADQYHAVLVNNKIHLFGLWNDIVFSKKKKNQYAISIDKIFGLCTHLQQCHQCAHKMQTWQQMIGKQAQHIQHQSAYHLSVGSIITKAIEKSLKKDKKSKRKKYKPNQMFIRENNNPNLCAITHVVTNVFIPTKLVNEIIPTAINVKIRDVRTFINKVIALQPIHDTNEHIKIIDFGFNHKDTNEILYCRIRKQIDGKCKWKMDEKLFTTKELLKFALPRFRRKNAKLQCAWLNTAAITNQLTMTKMQSMFKSCKWNTIPIFSRKNNTQRVTLSITAEKLSSKLKDFDVTLIDGFQSFCKSVSIPKRDIHWIDEEEYDSESLEWDVHNIENSNINLENKALFVASKIYLSENVERKNNNPTNIIPIIGYTNDIDYVWVFHINENTDIGISMAYNEPNNIKINGIYVDKDYLLEQHYLVSPQHMNDCKCLDGFVSMIHDIRIGNPDELYNKMKDYKQRYENMKEIWDKLRNMNGNDSLNSLQYDAEIIIQNNNGHLAHKLNISSQTVSPSISSNNATNVLCPQYSLSTPLNNSLSSQISIGSSIIPINSNQNYMNNNFCQQSNHYQPNVIFSNLSNQHRKNC